MEFMIFKVNCYFRSLLEILWGAINGKQPPCSQEVNILTFDLLFKALQRLYLINRVSSG